MSFSNFEDGPAESYFEGEWFARKGTTRKRVRRDVGAGK
jgi:hypothetical protein